eukprot:COSAG05_NODE_6_length_45604_cov_26.489660_2_plen_177_part_00
MRDSAPTDIYIHFLCARKAVMSKKPTHLAGGAPRPIRKYRMTIAHRVAPLDPLDEPLSTTAVAAGTPPALTADTAPGAGLQGGTAGEDPQPNGDAIPAPSEGCHPRSQPDLLSTAGVLVIRLPVSIHLVLSLTCRCAAHLMASVLPFKLRSAYLFEYVVITAYELVLYSRRLYSIT